MSELSRAPGALAKSIGALKVLEGGNEAFALFAEEVGNITDRMAEQDPSSPHVTELLHAMNRLSKSLEALEVLLDARYGAR